MNEYEVVGTAVRNSNAYTAPYEFSPRRKVFVVTQEYLQFELGWDMTEFHLTPAKAALLESELRLRQELPADTMIRGMQIDYSRDTVRIYAISPHFDPVEQNVLAPEQLIR